jgi:DNA excision repair protein ERCC-3
LKDPEIQNCRLRRDAEDDQLITGVVASSSKANLPKATNGNAGNEAKDQTNENNETSDKVPDDIYNYYEKMERDDEEAEDIKVVSFEVNQSEIETLQRRCIQLEYPLLAEYDFKNDTLNPDIK